MLDAKKKQKLIEEFRTHSTGHRMLGVNRYFDRRVKELTKHLKDHMKDFSSRRGLIKKFLNVVVF